MKTIFILATLLFTATHLAAQPLVSQEEYVKYQKISATIANDGFIEDPKAPKIIIFQPEVTKTVRAPFPIEVFFRPFENQKIAWGSFKALYGGMQFDITERLLKMATISDNSLYISNADIPVGIHRITLLIADDMQRKSQKEFIVAVEK
jgi:hypothetical protein